MTLKVTVASSSKSYSFGPLPVVLLLAFGEIASSTRVSEIPTSNDTRAASIADSGISQTLLRNATMENAAVESRTAKLLSRLDIPRKVIALPYNAGQSWNVSGNYSSVRSHSPTHNRTEVKNSTFIDAFLKKRAHSHERNKYPSGGHYAIYRAESGHHEGKRKSSYTAAVEDYNDHQQQVHNIATDYYPPVVQEYEDSYNTIPEDLNTSYDVPITPGYEQWQLTYAPNDPGYFGPPINGAEQPIYRDPPHTISGTIECNCPTTTRSYDCEGSSESFLALLGDLFHTIWALIKVVAVSSVPFLIPLLALKMIIVPLKILKILKLIKLFLKLFIILPLFVRVFYPALTNYFHLPKYVYERIQDALPGDEAYHPLDDEESRNQEGGPGQNSSLLPRDDRLLLDEVSVWDLRQCPSRVACETGAFLGRAGEFSYFPDNLVSYLARRADRALKALNRRKKRDGKKVDQQAEQEEEEEEEDQRDKAYKAFLIALGKKWPQEQCRAYRCPVLF